MADQQAALFGNSIVTLEPLSPRIKSKKEKQQTTPISQKVTHPSSTFCQQGLNSVTSKSTWLIAIREDDEKTDPKCLRGLPPHPTSLH